MTDIQKEIKEALAAATSGPWIVQDAEMSGEYLKRVTNRSGDIGRFILREDAHLIANAPTWLLHQQELIEQLHHRLDEGTDLVAEGMLLVETLGKVIEQKDAEIEKLREIQRLLVLSQLNTHE
jgi:hypothetical protein